LATILVAVLTLPGILVYLVLRPPRLLEEEYQSTLEEEALLRAIEDQIICPGCGRHLNQEWIVCPTCQTKVQKPCTSCGKLMELSWNICPFCGAPVPGLRKDNEKGEKIEEMTTGENNEKDIKD
jgi:RNA polymerase subunit RPABC4/transcription elongation factor Spt4